MQMVENELLKLCKKYFQGIFCVTINDYILNSRFDC